MYMHMIVFVKYFVGRYADLLYYAKCIFLKDIMNKSP